MHKSMHIAYVTKVTNTVSSASLLGMKHFFACDVFYFFVAEKVCWLNSMRLTNLLTSNIVYGRQLLCYEQTLYYKYLTTTFKFVTENIFSALYIIKWKTLSYTQFDLLKSFEQLNNNLFKIQKGLKIFSHFDRLP